MKMRTLILTLFSVNCFYSVAQIASAPENKTISWSPSKAMASGWNSQQNDYLHTPGPKANTVHFVSDRKDIDPGYIGVMGCGRFEKPYSIFRSDGISTVPVREKGTERWAGPPVYNALGDWMAVPAWNERCIQGTAGVQLMIYQRTVSKKADLDYMDQTWNLVRSIGQPGFKTTWHPAFHPSKPVLYFDAEGTDGLSQIYFVPLAAGLPEPSRVQIPGTTEAMYPTFHEEILYFSKPVSENNLDLFQWDGQTVAAFEAVNSPGHEFNWTVISPDSAWVNRRTLDNGTDAVAFVVPKNQRQTPSTLAVESLPAQAPVAAAVSGSTNSQAAPSEPHSPEGVSNVQESAYWIQAGVFNDAGKAQARAEALAQNPKVAKRISVQTDRQLYRVYVASGGNLAEAQGLLLTVKQKATEAQLQKITGPSSRSRKLEIYFDFNQAVIRPGEAKRIRDFLAELNGAQGTFDLIGHCDSRGSNGYNLQLGLRRAKSTAAYLSELAGSVPYTESSRSEWDLQSPCPDGVPCDESSHQRNRRVVLVFEPK